MRKETLILVVDDDESVRNIIAQFLNYHNYKTVCASDTNTGFELFTAMQPDVVITDLIIPDNDGIQFMEKIRDNSSETPVIIVTGLGVYEDAIRALKSGAWDFITKPIDFNILLHSIEKVLERSCLIIENRKYREELEKEVEIRTRQLMDKTRELEKTNMLLIEELKRRNSCRELIN